MHRILFQADRKSSDHVILFGSSSIVCSKVSPGVRGPRPHDQMPDFSYAGSFVFFSLWLS